MTGRRGQLTIEYLIVLVIMLLLFNYISMDLVETALPDALELQTIEVTRATKSLLNGTATALLLQGSGAKATVMVRAPVDCDVIVTENAVSLTCDSASPSAQYTGTVLSPASGALTYGPHKLIKRGELGNFWIERT